VLKNLSKPMQFALFAVLALAAWIVLNPGANEPKKASTKALASKTMPKGNDVLIADDFMAKASDFEPIKAVAKNVFAPVIKVVAKTGPGGKASQVNVVPPEFAGGEANWTYTGSAQIDGVLQALLENKTSGESVFLKVGDSWKGISVEEITDDSLVLDSPVTGTTRKLELPPDVVTGPAAGPSGFAPAAAPSPLQGNIGQMTVQPDGSLAPDMTGMGGGGNGGGNGGGGRRGRGGRGRGGGGGGGGNGGGFGGFGG
jgi:hypothetical protein